MIRIIFEALDLDKQNNMNPFHPRAAKSSHSVVILLTADDFTHQRRAPGWKKVKTICLTSDLSFSLWWPWFFIVKWSAIYLH